MLLLGSCSCEKDYKKNVACFEMEAFLMVFYLLETSFNVNWIFF